MGVLCTACGDEPPPEPGPISVTDAGETIRAVTSRDSDTVLGPVVIDGVSYSLTIPALAVGPDIEVAMTPVALGDAPVRVLGAFRFEPSGLEFLVPATLIAEGVSGSAFAAASLEDDGTGATFAFAPVANGVVRAYVEHFSVHAIVDAANDAAVAISAANIANVPQGVFDSVGPLAEAYNVHVAPAIARAGDSLTAFAFAARMLSEWNGAMQARNIAPEHHEALGERTFGETLQQATGELVTAAQRLFADLSQGTCRDGTGRLDGPSDWVNALLFVADQLSVFGGVAAEPSFYEPCITLRIMPEVLLQAGPIPREKRVVNVFVGLDGISPTGRIEAMRGSFSMALQGAIGPGGNNPFEFDPEKAEPVVVPVDRGEECALRTHTLVVELTGALQGTRRAANFGVQPATARLEFPDTGRCPCTMPAALEDPVCLEITGDVAATPTALSEPGIARLCAHAQEGGTPIDTFTVAWSADDGTLAAATTSTTTGESCVDWSSPQQHPSSSTPVTITATIDVGGAQVVVPTTITLEPSPCLASSQPITDPDRSFLKTIAEGKVIENNVLFAKLVDEGTSFAEVTNSGSGFSYSATATASVVEVTGAATTTGTTMTRNVTATAQSEMQKQLVVLSGSGTGTATLVFAVEGDLNSERGALFFSGEFDPDDIVGNGEASFFITDDLAPTHVMRTVTVNKSFSFSLGAPRRIYASMLLQAQDDTTATARLVSASVQIMSCQP